MEKLPRQGNSVVKTRVRIKSWAEIHEEKWRRVPTKPEEKIQVHKKRVIRGMHGPMLMDGGEGKKLKFFCVVKDIEHQRGKR